MRISFIMTILAILFLGSTVSAQKIVMKIKNVAPLDGEVVKALEFKIDAESSWIKGGGAAIGKPVPSSLLIKKDFGVFTNEIIKKIVPGTSFPEISFEYFKNDGDKGPFYIITIFEIFVTQSYFLSPECPTCLSLEHQFGFVFKKIKFDDRVNNKVSIWDIAMNKLE